jgi:hypothetical protein
MPRRKENAGVPEGKILGVLEERKPGGSKTQADRRRGENSGEPVEQKSGA